MRPLNTATNLFFSAHIAVWAQPIVPIHQVKAGCLDPRHPAMANGWLSSCDSDGAVEQLVRMESDMAVDLSNASDDWVSPQFWVGGIQGGFFHEGELDGMYRLVEPLISPAMASDQFVVGLGASKVWIKSVMTQKITTIDARPKPWQLPAVLDEQVAWVNDDGHGGSDILIWSEAVGVTPLATGSVWQHGVVSFKGHWAWLEPDSVVLYNVESRTEQRIPSRVVDGLTPFEAGVCWSAINDQDLDVYCSDGFVLEREGHQRWPYRYGANLIFRERNEVMKWIIPQDQTH